MPPSAMYGMNMESPKYTYVDSKELLFLNPSKQLSDALLREYF